MCRQAVTVSWLCTIHSAWRQDIRSSLNGAVNRLWMLSSNSYCGRGITFNILLLTNCILCTNTSRNHSTCMQFNVIQCPFITYSIIYIYIACGKEHNIMDAFSLLFALHFVLIADSIDVAV